MTMPIAYVYTWSKLLRKDKERIIKGITKVFEELRVPRR
jgi:phenylpyruvate tautomerase PptA (4-oxalocrotonate tautomerase family)